MEYHMEFNNQNYEDETHCKLLLMIPMVPQRYHSHIKLNHLKLYNEDNIKQRGKKRETSCMQPSTTNL